MPAFRDASCITILVFRFQIPQAILAAGRRKFGSDSGTPMRRDARSSARRRPRVEAAQSLAD
jgi:hypothetical protein